MNLQLVENKTSLFHIEMVEALAKNNEDFITGLTKAPNAGHNLHMAIGIVGEVAEVMENIIERKGRENLVEELGDTDFYVRGLADSVGFKGVLTTFNIIPKVETRVIHIACLLTIKAGAIIDTVKRQGIYEKELDTSKLFEQLTGLLYLLEAIRVVALISRQECLEHNIAKLGKRYSGGTYTNQSAQDRADKLEGE